MSKRIFIVIMTVECEHEDWEKNKSIKIDWTLHSRVQMNQIKLVKSVGRMQHKNKHNEM